MKSLNDRYKNDFEFNSLVKMFRSFYEKTRFTPNEIREAAMIAQMQFERENPAIFAEDFLKFQKEFYANYWPSEFNK